MRDVCILPDAATQTYYMIGPGRNAVRAYTSKDLINWDGPPTINKTPEDVWGDVPVVGIWAPEMQKYKGKYYVFLTFDTRTKLGEQWREWYPRVVRGSSILHSDFPLGPFASFQHQSTLPADMMTLDGTLWVEGGVPYMVFAHEWVQITNLLLNISPKADGTIPDEQQHLLRDIGKWLDVNGEAIDGTRPWKQASEDKVRFATKGDASYAIYVGKPGDTLTIPALAASAGKATNVAMLGSDATVEFSQSEKGLTLKPPGAPASDVACAFKISGLLSR